MEEEERRREEERRKRTFNAESALKDSTTESTCDGILRIARYLYICKSINDYKFVALCALF